MADFNFGTQFVAWKRKAGFIRDNDLSSLFSDALVNHEKAQEILEKAVQESWGTRKMAALMQSHYGIDTAKIFEHMNMSDKATAPEKSEAPVKKMAGLVLAADGESDTAGGDMAGANFKPVANEPPANDANQTVEEENLASDGEGGEEVGSDGDDVVIPLPRPRSATKHRLVPGPNTDSKSEVGISEPEPGGLKKLWKEQVTDRFGGSSGRSKTPAHQKSNQNSSGDSKKKGGSYVLIGIGVVVLLAVLGLMFFSATLLGSQGYSPQVAELPQEPVFSNPSNTTQPAFVPEEAERIIELTEPMLRKPTSFDDFLKNFPFRWVMWLLFLFPLFGQLSQDRFAAAEKTDLFSITVGLVVMSVLIVLSGLLGRLLASWIVTSSQFTAYPPDLLVNMTNVIKKIVEYLLVGAGVVLNLGMQLSASQSGKKDYSALSVAGFFASGVILIWWYAGQTGGMTIGWLMILIGMYLQTKEMSRTHQTGGVVLVSMIMILLFFIGFVVGMFASNYILLFNLPDIFLYIVYKSSIVVSVSVGFLFGWAGGDFVATRWLTPVKLRELSSDGDSASSVAGLDVTVKYDAVAFGIMLMYPLATLLWYASAFSTLF